MNPARKLLPALLLLPFSCALADPAPQPQMVFTQGSANTWNSQWDGVTQRTYFYEWSLDLVNWHFAPFMEFGNGSKSWGIDASDGGGVPLEKIFVRLRYVDAPWISTLQQAKDADFDGDGIPNLYEVETVGSNPLDKTSAGGDADGDGAADGWERFYFGDPSLHAGDYDPDDDGLTSKEESELGSNPLLDESATNSGQQAEFSYDATGRLTGMTAPVGTATYSPDEEGNILGAQ